MRNHRKHIGHHGRRFARNPDAMFGDSFRQGGRHQGRPGGGRRSGLGRFFAHGDLRLVILQLIAEKPSHGYEIIKAIEDRVAGTYSPSAGSVYPVLTMIEELGYVTLSTSEGNKKLHTITPEGEAFLASNHATIKALFVRMSEAAKASGGEPPAPVVRGMENLKLALRMRLSRGDLTADAIKSIAAILDQAATSIEQS